MLTAPSYSQSDARGDIILFGKAYGRLTSNRKHRRRRRCCRGPRFIAWHIGHERLRLWCLFRVPVWICCHWGESAFNSAFFTSRVPRRTRNGRNRPCHAPNLRAEWE